MFKGIILLIIAVTIAVTIITQIILPLLIPKLELFWWFKPKIIHEKTTIEQLNEKVDIVVNEYKTTVNEVETTLETIKQIKNKTKI
jgi:hypothetical protein